MSLKPGQRVKLSTCPEWGPGEILTITNGKITVYFALVGQKTLIQTAVLEKISCTEAAHPFLDNRILSSNRGAKTRSISSLRDSFSQQFPDGFSDPRYFKTERDYKVNATELVADSLNREELKKLISAGDYSGVCKRALAVVNKTNLIFPNEKMALKDGLSGNPADREKFARALDQLLHHPSDFESRFMSFAKVLEGIGVAKWTIATYFPFLAYPAEHMFLKPVVTQSAADACDFEIHYQAKLNWRTYSLLLKFCSSLREAISDLKPRDMIDLQSFIWCIGDRE